MPIHQAQWKGVRFDVVSVSDNFSRSTIEHAYPFVNGADVEDLGLASKTVKMQAVFYGEGYFAQFKAFLNVIQKQGADVLVHPILGRLPDMLLTSATLNHEAERIDYVALDLTFVESTPAKPIFVLESALLSKVDKILSDLESFADGAVDVFSKMMEAYAMVAHSKARLLGVCNTLLASVEGVCDVLGSAKEVLRMPTSLDPVQIKAFGKQAGKALKEAISSGMGGVVDSSEASSQKSLSASAQMDGQMRTFERLQAIPRDCVLGKNQKQGSVLVGYKPLSNAMIEADSQAVVLLIQSLAITQLLHNGALLIEDESLTPQEMETITCEMREKAQSVLCNLRAQYKEEASNPQQPNTPIYQAVQAQSEVLRNLIHQFTQLAIVAINKKPPLIVRSAPMDGTLTEMAHAFYGDYQRKEELLRLNPQIHQPNFIAQGALLNSYAE